MYDIASIFTQFYAYTKFGDFIVDVLKKIFRRILFHRCFRGSSLEDKKSSALCFTVSHAFMFFFEIAQVYLRSAGCKVYKGHL